MAPTASVAGGVQIAARVVETALHKLHELDFDVRRVVAGFGSCPLPPVAGDDMAAIGRTNDAVLYGGQVHLTVEADDDDALRDLVERLPASASSDYGEPFGSVLKDADFDFYEIDPLLFSPAQIRLTSVAQRPQLRGGRGQPRGAGALVLGLTVAILGSSGGWHAQQLTDALAARGHEHRLVPVTRMVGRIDGDVAVRSRDVWLDGCDAVIVRGIPRGSLEQVIFRVDALHALEARGVTCVNGPRALERTVDKFLASALLARAGVPTPRTIACERLDDALEAFEELGGDVIVKPLFGSMGAGMTRVDDADVAYRVFHALELERAVYYLQETLPHDGRDLRALVVGGRVLAAIERVGSGWRANLARGARGAGHAAERRAGAPVPGGRGGPRRRLRGRRRAAGRRRARLRARAQRDPRLARAAGGHGRRRGRGARRAPRGAGQRSSRQLARADDAAVQRGRDERAGGAGGVERPQVVDVAHAAAGQQLEVREGAVELGDQRDVRARAAAHAREVEHDRLAQAGAVQAREGVERGQARELRVGRQHAARRAGRRSGPRRRRAAPRAGGRARRGRSASPSRR